MFTCRGLDSCAPVPSVLSGSWVQASSTCYHSANPKIINQVTWFCSFWTGAGLYPASSDLKWTSNGICLRVYALQSHRILCSFSFPGRTYLILPLLSFHLVQNLGGKGRVGKKKKKSFTDIVLTVTELILNFLFLCIVLDVKYGAFYLNSSSLSFFLSLSGGEGGGERSISPWLSWIVNEQHISSSNYFNRCSSWRWHLNMCT